MMIIETLWLDDLLLSLAHPQSTSTKSFHYYFARVDDGVHLWDGSAVGLAEIPQYTVKTSAAWRFR
jgi:hypothetical protein